MPAQTRDAADHPVRDEDPPVRSERRNPGYWRVTFDNAPINLYDPEVEATLAGIVDKLEADPDVKVVVFDSALPDFLDLELNMGERIGPRT